MLIKNLYILAFFVLQLFLLLHHHHHLQYMPVVLETKNLISLFFVFKKVERAKAFKVFVRHNSMFFRFYFDRDESDFV
jgi:hypothetical protein